MIRKNVEVIKTFFSLGLRGPLLLLKSVCHFRRVTWQWVFTKYHEEFRCFCKNSPGSSSFCSHYPSSLGYRCCKGLWPENCQLQRTWKVLTLKPTFFFPSLCILLCLFILQAIRTKMPYAVVMWQKNPSRVKIPFWLLILYQPSIR